MAEEMRNDVAENIQVQKGFPLTACVIMVVALLLLFYFF